MRRLFPQPLRWFAAALAVVVVAVACGANSSPPTAGPMCDNTTPSGLILAVAVHRNVPAPDLPGAIACPLRQTIIAHHPVAVIAEDGQPRVLMPPTVADVTSVNAGAHEDDVQQATSQVLDTVRHAQASSNGADLLSSVALASDTARSAGIQNPTIIVVDSGLSDTGAVQLTQPGMAAARPQDVAKYVAAQHELPDLAGARVDLVGIAYASPPQQPLTIAQRANVTAIWTAILTAAGATVTAVPVARTGPGPQTPFTTRTVDFPQPKPFTPVVGHTYVFDDSSPVGFRFDSTAFRDQAAALQELTPLARWLAGASGRRASLRGTTDSIGTADYNARLSLDRAHAVKDLLTSLGAPAAALTARGDGYTANPPDVGPDGSLDPAKAAQNRSVQITLAQNQ